MYNETITGRIPRTLRKEEKKIIIIITTYNYERNNNKSIEILRVHNIIHVYTYNVNNTIIRVYSLLLFIQTVTVYVKYTLTRTRFDSRSYYNIIS